MKPQRVVPHRLRASLGAAVLVHLLVTSSARGQCEPALLGAYDTPGHANIAAVSNGVAYVASNLSGLWLIDVSDAANPTPIGYSNTAGESRDVVVSGALAYMAHGSSGLHVIDGGSWTSLKTKVNPHDSGALRRDRLCRASP
ncbi:MAG: hypothetical protein GY715_10945 [Planctomycetes bacterium]|nr:hypothetical protein [Planctomycetota bacterium]